MQMHVNVVRPNKLTEQHLAEWQRLQRLDPVLESPYLCPKFVEVAAQVCPNVVVAVAEQDGRPVAFLPMQLRGGIAGPVACPLSDCQAIIAEKSWDGDPRQLIRAAGISAYDFNHQRLQPYFAPYHRSVCASPVINLANGFDDYVATMAARGRESLDTSSGRPHQTMKKARRLARKVGPLRFTMHETDAGAMPALIEWKRQQYRETGKVMRFLDLFSYGWTTDLLRRIHATQSDEFAGVLSTLRIGDTLIAAHMGMRSHNVLHWWFPAYDKQYASFSPGLILLLEMCRMAPAMGIREIELGAGDETYKDLVANDRIMVASGFVGFRSMPLWSRYFIHEMDAWVSRMPLGDVGTWPGRLLRRMDRRRWLRSNV